MKTIMLILFAVLIDYKVGDPSYLPHPIIAIGRWIQLIEKGLRAFKLDGYIGGGLLWLLSASGVWLVVTMLVFVARQIHPMAESLLILYGSFAALAATCLAVEVRKVSSALSNDGLQAARKALSFLVGRDTNTLSEEEVIKGAIETTAENTIDGVLAPLFFLFLGTFMGMPLQMVFLYKTVNTLDSMVGYIQAPYTRFGYVSAKMDDLFNLIPARIGSFVMLLAGGVLGEDIRRGIKIFRKDRYNHRSPNAGHPESVIAGLLGLELGGTHRYFNQILEKPIIGKAVQKPTIAHIDTTIRIMYMSEFIFLMTGICVVMLVTQ